MKRKNAGRAWFAIGLAACFGLLAGQLDAADALSRLQKDRLQAVHDAVAAYQAQRQPVQLQTGYEDVRALLHVHSKFSHDSRGTIDEILVAAQATGVRVLLFSEHPAEHYDYYSDGHHDMHDGVLLVPGAETGGFLAYPTRSLKGEKTNGPQEFANLVRRDGGLVFLSHLEERMDWNIDGLTGTEIYNTHADVKDEKNFMAALRNPLTMFGILPVMRQYPQESFAALQDYPSDYLKRWDELCRKTRLTGIAANDSHQNQAIVFRLTEKRTVTLEDALGKKLIELDPLKIDLLKDRIADKQPGDIVFEQYLDRYEYSFHYVSTHLLMKELTREQVWDALQEGRAYVAFDWIADPTGFAFIASRGDRMWPVGSEVPQQGDIRLRAAAPLSGTFKLVHDGKVMSEVTARDLDVTVSEPGTYRVEVWLKVADEDRPWILSNPIYIRPNCRT